jgi:hypothetical protein
MPEAHGAICRIRHDFPRVNDIMVPYLALSLAERPLTSRAPGAARADERVPGRAPSRRHRGAATATPGPITASLRPITNTFRGANA